MGEKAKAKAFDATDESFCGFMALSIIDSDGYGKKTKGADIKGPLYMVSDGASEGPVVLEAEFTLNPLFYLGVPNEEGQLLWGQWWIGEKNSQLTNIGSAVPKLCMSAHKDMEKTPKEFTLEVEMPLLRNAPSKLCKATVTTVEQKFLTKVAKVKLEIPRASWTEWKNHRMRFWQYGKNQAGSAPSGGGGGDDKDDEKKDEEKKED